MRTRVAVFLATLISALVVLVGLGALPAAAEGESIFGFLKNAKGKELQPVPGVKVTVKGPGGINETATSDDQGRWTVEVGKPGTFTVTLDQDTLPKGVTLRNPDADSLKVPVAEGQDKPVLFALGKSTRQVQSKWEQAAQLTAEGLRFGLILALAAVGLSLIFGTTGLTNFAHGELVTLGALLTWWISVGNLPFLPDFGGLQFFPAAAIALVLCAGFGWANDAWLWRPLRRRGTGLIAAMIVSIGLEHLPALLLPLHLHRQHPAVPRLPGPEGHRPRPDRPGRATTTGRWPWRSSCSSPRSWRCSAPASARRPGRSPTTRRSRRRPASTSTG